MTRGSEPAGGTLAPRLIRAGLVLGLGWIALEIALANLIARQIGWAATVMLISLKGGVGLALVGLLAFRGLVRLRRSRRDGPRRGSVEAGFAVASAVLIALPGLVPALLGIALFSPGLRLKVLGWLRPIRQAGPPPEIELPASEWRELKTRKRRASRKKRDPALEARPPSV